ncbi:hypothetical protein M8C21_001426, partial [Ambrosia artemisiifolia]
IVVAAIDVFGGGDTFRLPDGGVVQTTGLRGFENKKVFMLVDMICYIGALDLLGFCQDLPVNIRMPFKTNSGGSAIGPLGVLEVLLAPATSVDDGVVL